MPDQLQKLKTIITLANEGLTRSEFKKSFELVLALVKQLEKRFTFQFDLLKNNLLAKIDKRLSEVKDGKDGRDGKAGKDGADGKNADEETLLLSVLSQMPTLETIAEEAVKLIPKTEERVLSVDDINGLKEMFEEMKTARVGGRGGAPVHKFIDDETPVGTVNGVNTEFKLAKAPRGLQIFVNGQRMTITTDYTIAGQTVTFLTAPPTGSIIRADYRF
jgi:hypothetical protein